MIGYEARQESHLSFRWRSYVLLAILGASALALGWRAANLALRDHGFLASQGNARFTRVASIVAHRGTIIDRYGEPLAVSTPVDSVWINPRELALATDQIPRLAAALKLDRQELTRRVTSNLDREFLYLARHLQPAEAQQIRALEIPGVYLSREYRRYFPPSEVTGHMLGFTNVDDAGQEGLELAFDHWLAGEDGAKRVIQDRYGRVVQDVDSIRSARPGRDLILSIDLRIQYLAYRELKAAILQQRARAGSVIVLDVATGEVLAMVNQPAYNPNDREQFVPSTYRNRAATDIFEPGSSIKPFFVAAGLVSGKYDDHSMIDTAPGFIKVGVKTIEDEHGNLGAINLATVLAKSSNVGMARLALSLEPQLIWKTLTSLGFGQVTTSGYPGESAGPFERLFALAAHRHRDHVARLRAFGDAAAARAGLRDHRRPGRASSGVASCASTHRPAVSGCSMRICAASSSACSSRWLPPRAPASVPPSPATAWPARPAPPGRPPPAAIPRIVTWRCSPAWRRRAIRALRQWSSSTSPAPANTWAAMWRRRCFPQWWGMRCACSPWRRMSRCTRSPTLNLRLRPRTFARRRCNDGALATLG